MERIRKVFAKNFKIARKKSGLSMRQLAPLLKTTHISISLWENGKALPQEQFIDKIAEVLKVDSDWLLGIKSESDQFSSQLSNMPSLDTVNIPISDAWMIDLVNADEDKKEAMRKIWLAVKKL